MAGDFRGRSSVSMCAELVKLVNLESGAADADRGDRDEYKRKIVYLQWQILTSGLRSVRIFSVYHARLYRGAARRPASGF